MNGIDSDGNFPDLISDCGSQSPDLLDFFLSFDSGMSYSRIPSIGKHESYCCLRFHWLSFKLKKGVPLSHHTAYTYYRVYRGGLHGHSIDVP